MLGLYLRSLKSVEETRCQSIETLGAVSRNVFSSARIRSLRCVILLICLGPVRYLELGDAEMLFYSPW